MRVDKTEINSFHPRQQTCAVRSVEPTRVQDALIVGPLHKKKDRRTSLESKTHRRSRCRSPLSLTNGASFTTDNVVKTLNALVVAARASLDVRPARHTSAGARKHKHPATRSVGSREKTIVTTVVLLAFFVVPLLSLISSLFTGSAVFCSGPTQMDGNCPPMHCARSKTAASKGFD